MKIFETFVDLGLPELLAKNLEKMEFSTPTPIQKAAIPEVMLGKDVLGTAQTGTGKTGAFSIPLLLQLYDNPKKQGLILCPTRELAAQIHRVIRQMAKGLHIEGSLVVGGESFNRQADELYRGVDYIVATPGRLNDHLQSKTCDLSNVGFLVLDEVDRMLDMGFAPQIRDVMRHLPSERQTMVFSATLPPETLALAMKLLKNPSRIAIGATTQPIGQVEENTIHTTREKKTDLVVDEVNARAGKVLVFTRTKSRADRLARVLFAKGHQVVCLHGGRSQGQRKQALERFRTGSHRIMVATDLAGRGIDVADIEHVINYDLPANREDYIHRIGRTGRFGKKGQALNLLENGDSEGEEVITGIKAKRGAVRSLPTGGRSSAPRRRQNSFGRNSSAGRPEKRSFGRR